MIEVTQGNIINAQAEALVNTVNTVGIMGKGIALSFKKAFPDNYKAYREAVDAGAVSIGKMFVTETGQLYPKYIINFPTKVHWKGSSKYSYVEEGLKDLISIVLKNKIKSIAIPPLGSGNGKLDWNVVKPMIQKHFEPLAHDVRVVIFDLGFNDQNVTEKPRVELTPARAMLLYILHKYRVLGYSVNLLVIQKVAWILQRLGEPMRANFEKGPYGPYSHEVTHLLKYLNGTYISYKEAETKPGTTVHLALERFVEIEAYHAQMLSIDQKARLNKALEIIEGFESPFGLELLATVDFIRKQNPTFTLEDVQREIHSWTTRKRELMQPHHIKVAFERVRNYIS